MLQKFLCDARSLIDIAAADAKRAIYYRRIIKDESLFARRSAVSVEHFHFLFEQTRGQFTGIRNRRRTANELRITAVKIRNPPDPPQHVTQMAAEHAAIGVKLVNHDVAKIFEKARPTRVVRQNAGMQHVRIREHHVTLFADGFARVGGRVAVISKDAEAVVEPLVEVIKLRKLILRQSLGREEVQSASIRIFENRIQYR